MKSWSLFVSPILLVFVLALDGCDQAKKVVGGDVALVKSTTLDVDKSLTIGQAFEKYKYFKSTKWEAYQSDNARRGVNMTAEFDVSRYPNLKDNSDIKSAYLKFQFVINQDKTVEVRWCGLGFEKKNGEIKEPDESISLQTCMNTVKEVYNNEPKETANQTTVGKRNTAGQVYNYNKNVVINGTIVTATADATITADEKPHNYLAVKFNTPVSLACLPTDQYCEPETDVYVMQLAGNYDYDTAKKSVNKEVTIDGELFHSDNGHHFTKVLVDVKKMAVK